MISFKSEWNEIAEFLDLTILFFEFFLWLTLACLISLSRSPRFLYRNRVSEDVQA